MLCIFWSTPPTSHVLWNTSSRAWCSVRPSKPKCQHLEQRKFYCRAKKGEWVVGAKKKSLNSGMVFRKEMGLVWGFFWFFFFPFFLQPYCIIGKFPGQGSNQSCNHTTTVTWNLSHLCNLHHISRQCQILNPLNAARDQPTSSQTLYQVLNPLSLNQNSSG